MITLEQEDLNIRITFWRERTADIEKLMIGDIIDITDVSIKKFDDGRRYFNVSDSTEVKLVKIKTVFLIGKQAKPLGAMVFRNTYL